MADDVIGPQVESFMALNFSAIPGDPKKNNFCLIKREIHNKRGFFKNETCLDCQ